MMKAARLAVLASLWFGAGHAALAEPSTSFKSGPDALAVTTYWVKCDNGNVATAECRVDKAHCGARRDTPLRQQAVKACDSIVGLMMSVEPRK